MKTLFFLSIAINAISQYSTSNLLSETAIPKYDPIYSKILSESSNREIQIYKKYELGIHLSDSIMDRINAFLFDSKTPAKGKLNPFLEWEIDVEACFINQATNDSIIVDAFYYQDYERNLEINDWDLKDSEFPFRIRFTPTQIGKWSQLIRIQVKDESTLFLSEQIFEVVSNENHGFVKVHPNAKNLMLDDEIIFPIGQNFSSPDEGVTFYHNNVRPELAPDQTHKAADVYDWIQYLKMVENYLDQGGKYIRTIQTPWSSLIEFEEKGNYVKRLQYAWEQDNLIEICDKNNAFVLFNLFIHEPFMNFGDYSFYDWDWDKYNDVGEHSPTDPYPVFGYNSDPARKQPHEMFLLEEDLMFHEQRTRYYISRYGYSTSIYEFELLSEPFHLDQFWKSEGGSLEPYFDLKAKNHDIVEKAINNYHLRIAHYIKNDLHHTNHLIGVNTSMFLWTPHGLKITDSSLFSSDIDVIGMNPYSINTEKLIISKTTKSTNLEFGEHENSYAKMIHDYHALFHKPVLFSECGPSESYFECSNYIEFDIDNNTFPFTGIAGYNMWNGFRPKEYKLWESTILAQEKTQNIVVPIINNGNWLQGRQKEKLKRKDAIESKELQYYISDSLFAVGYVRNRTYNFYTKRTDSSCTLPNYERANYPLSTLKNIKWNDGKKKNYLKIQGLDNGYYYTIEWFSDGQHISNSIYGCNRKGDLILEFPELNVEVGGMVTPILWFRIERFHSVKLTF